MNTTDHDLIARALAGCTIIGAPVTVDHTPAYMRGARDQLENCVHAIACLLARDSAFNLETFIAATQLREGQ